MCVSEFSRQVDCRNLEGIYACHNSTGAWVPAAGSSGGSRPSLMFGPFNQQNISEWRGSDRGRLPVASSSRTLVFHRSATWLLASPQLLSRLGSHSPKLPFYASSASSFRAFLIFTKVKPPSLGRVSAWLRDLRSQGSRLRLDILSTLAFIFTLSFFRSYISCIVVYQFNG